MEATCIEDIGFPFFVVRQRHMILSKYPYPVPLPQGPSIDSYCPQYHAPSNGDLPRVHAEAQVSVLKPRRVSRLRPKADVLPPGRHLMRMPAHLTRSITVAARNFKSQRSTIFDSLLHAGEPNRPWDLTGRPRKTPHRAPEGTRGQYCMRGL